jgi:hypothetical protein
MDEESFKLAMQLMQEEIAANESAAKSEKEAAGGDAKTDETKKQVWCHPQSTLSLYLTASSLQEDLDLQLAMEIQNALNAQQPKPVYGSTTRSF